jgi:hypothetical protein
MSTKKYEDELKALNTPDIRSTLRWLNNNVEKHVKATLLASMKHDAAMAAIQKHYSSDAIGKALKAVADGVAARPRAETTANGQPRERRAFDVVMRELHEIAGQLDHVVKDMKQATHNTPPASYVLPVDPVGVFIIAASAAGATVLDGPHPTVEEAMKAWPEAIPPTKPEQTIEDLL